MDAHNNLKAHRLMLTRRHLLACTAMGGLLLAVAPAQAQGAIAPAQATSFVVNLGNQLVAIINGPGGYEDKKRRLQPLVENAADIDNIARFCLGRYVREASPAQLAEYTRLFHQVIMNNIFGKIGELQGVTFQPTTTVARDADVLVGTTIQRPNQGANTVQWVVNAVGGQPKIVDIVAEGTSLRLTQRADYASYLSRNNNNIDALIAAVKQQVSR